MGRALKVINHLLDNRHRIAGADPARGPNLWSAWNRKNGIHKGIFRSGKKKRGKINSNRSQGLRC